VSLHLLKYNYKGGIMKNKIININVRVSEVEQKMLKRLRKEKCINTSELIRKYVREAYEKEFIR